MLAFLLAHFIAFAIINVSLYVSLVCETCAASVFLIILLFFIVSSYINLTWNILNNLKKQNIWYNIKKCGKFSDFLKD